MTFRVRTALVVLVLTAVTMGVAFATVWGSFVSSQQRHLDDALLAIALDEATAAATGRLEFTDAPGPFANAVGPLPKYGVIYSADGATLSHTSNFVTVPPLPGVIALGTGFDFEHDGKPMRGVVVRVPGSARRVLLASPRDDFEDDTRTLTRAMAIAFAVGCLWAAVVAFGVATLLTREHRSLGDVARRVASGDMSARVAFRSSDVDLRQLAGHLNAMIERLVGLLALQERFIAHASHELRTPLTSLRIELEHVLRTGRDRADYESALRGALDSAGRLTDLAEDLLQLARVKATPGDETTWVGAALLDAVGDVAPAAKLRGVNIVAEPPSARARGDRRGLARLFRNVLENAARFAPAGSLVRVEGRMEEERVVVRVLDEGPGIAAEDTERIFEPFTRRTRADGPEGTGLGLSIARALARSFGGDVTAEVGPGGRFVVNLRPIAGVSRREDDEADRPLAGHDGVSDGLAGHGVISRDVPGAADEGGQVSVPDRQRQL
jgi:two-component system OmpR family sensor kinase